MTWMKLKCKIDGLVIAWCLLSNFLWEELLPPGKITLDVHIRRGRGRRFLSCPNVYF